MFHILTHQGSSNWRHQNCTIIGERNRIIYVTSNQIYSAPLVLVVTLILQRWQSHKKLLNMSKINIIRIQSQVSYLTKNRKRNDSFCPNSNGGNRWANWASIQIQKSYQGQFIEGTQLTMKRAHQKLCFQISDFKHPAFILGSFFEPITSMPHPWSLRLQLQERNCLPFWIPMEARKGLCTD